VSLPRILPDHGTAAREGRVVILPVSVGTIDLGINLVHVRAVTLQGPTRTLPDGPSYLIGFIELNGQAIAVVDLAERLGCAHALPAGDRKLVLTNDDRAPFASLICVFDRHPVSPPFVRRTISRRSRNRLKRVR